MGIALEGTPHNSLRIPGLRWPSRGLGVLSALRMSSIRHLSVLTALMFQFCVEKDRLA